MMVQGTRRNSANRFNPTRSTNGRDLLPWADPYIASLFSEERSNPNGSGDEDDRFDVEIDFGGTESR